MTSCTGDAKTTAEDTCAEYLGEEPPRSHFSQQFVKTSVLGNFDNSALNKEYAYCRLCNLRTSSSRAPSMYTLAALKSFLRCSC